MSVNWRFLVVVAAFIQFFVTAGPVYNYNVFFVDLKEEFQKSAVFTGWVGSLGSGVYCAVVPLAAIVATKLGNLRLVLLGTILASAGYLSTSFIPSLEYGYLTFGLLVGLGSSLANCAAGSLLLDWYSGHESSCRATGGALIGTSFGVMVFGPVLNTLRAAYGWRNCFRILSGIVLLLGLAGAIPFLKSPANRPAQTGQDDTLTVSSTQNRQSPDEEQRNGVTVEERDRSEEPNSTSVDGDLTKVRITTVAQLTSQKRQSPGAEQRNGEIVEETDTSEEPNSTSVDSDLTKVRITTVTHLTSQKRQSPGAERRNGEIVEETDKSEEPNSTSVDSDLTKAKVRITKIFLDAEMWLWVTAITLAQFGWSFVILNFSSFMEGIGLSTEQISLALLVFGAAEVGCKILFAMFGDRLPCLKLYLIACSSLGGAVVSGFLTLCSTFQHMIVLATAWGIFRGGTYGACIAAGDELFGVYGSRAVTSIVLLGFGLGILGSPIIGNLYDLTGDYTLSLLVLVASFVLASLSMLLIPAKRKIQARLRCCHGNPTTPTPDHSHSSADLHISIAETPIRNGVGHSNPAYEIEI
ncbi:monocarboxylate transporter 13-like [Patiria miniata]|uniref:Major facilitator superfamily (MFS) profile domain-containing protein n=1 Tax=Patiria miniata TaxID=46514 RepID=A0A913ZWR2_PATMI|nr:monocarboxylate transporter 13-like [Patiria miniata]